MAAIALALILGGLKRKEIPVDLLSYFFGQNCVINDTKKNYNCVIWPSLATRQAGKIRILSFSASRSMVHKPGVILPYRGLQVMSGDIFGCNSLGRGTATGI